MVMVDEISFPPQITTTKPLSLLGHGITDIEIHFLQIKFTAIGVYLDPEIVGHLQQWKGKTGKELAENDDFFEALISAPVEKLLRVGVIKEIKGSQYGVQLESAVRDRLAADDKYEEEEEEALEKVVEFFQSKYFKKNSIIMFHFPATSSTAEISFATEGKEDSKIQIENPNVVEMIKKWYLGGTRGVSSTTISCLANTLSAKLSTTHQPTNCNETMTTETVMVDEIPFPPQVATTKPLYLLGHGITDIEIHFLQIKFTAIGVYLDPAIVGHLQQWKGKTGKELAEDDDFFEAIIFAPVEKLLRIVVIKEIKGSQYGVQLESAVRDRLAADDKYEEEEEEALERVVEFFQSKYFKKNSVITFHFPATSGTTAEISFATDGKEDSKIQVENANVVEMIKKWYLGGTRGVSPSTISCLANTLSVELSK